MKLLTEVKKCAVSAREKGINIAVSGSDKGEMNTVRDSVKVSDKTP
jgi:hypothetical protein